jgi:hypothetical protein
MKLEAKKKEISEKMIDHSELGGKSKFNAMLKNIRNKKGRESLNSPKRGRDNDVALGKNEQEKN